MNTGFSATYTSKKPNCFRVRSLRPLGYISMLYKRVPLPAWQHPAAKTTHIFYSTFAYSASSKMTEYKNIKIHITELLFPVPVPQNWEGAFLIRPPSHKAKLILHASPISYPDIFSLFPSLRFSRSPQPFPSLPYRPHHFSQ